MKLSFGLIGGGGISQSHIIGATFENLAELKAGCFSRDIDKNKNFGHLHGLSEERIYSDYKTMAEMESKRDDKIDFAIVTTPNISHYEICKEFLNNGIGVICDKPLTVSVKQAVELEKIAEEKNLLCATTYTFGGFPFIHLMKEIYQSGEVGIAYYITAKYYRGARLAEIFANDIKTWRFTKEISGQGGAIADLGTHVEFIARFVMGCDIDQVLAKLINKPGKVELDTTGAVLLKFTNGIDGLITVAQAACGHDNDIEVEILCEKGTISWCFKNSGELKIDYLDGKSVIHREPGVKYESIRKFDHKQPVLSNAPVSGFINIYSGFIKTMISRKNGEQEYHYFPTFTDGVKGVMFVEACVDSQNNNNIWMHIDAMEDM